MDTRHDWISNELGTAAGAVGLLLLGVLVATFCRQALDPAIRAGDSASAARALAGLLVALAAVGILIIEGLDAVRRVWRLFSHDARFQRTLSRLAHGAAGGRSGHPEWAIAWAIWVATRRPMTRSMAGLALLGVAGWLCW